MSANKENKNEKQDKQNRIKSPNMDLEQLLPLLIRQAISGIDMDVENDQRDIGACYNERDIGAKDKERDIGSQKALVEDSVPRDLMKRPKVPIVLTMSVTLFRPAKEDQ